MNHARVIVISGQGQEGEGEERIEEVPAAASTTKTSPGEGINE